MSKEVIYTDAADWSDADAKENYAYLESRGRVFELQEALKLRDESWDDVFSAPEPVTFPQPVEQSQATGEVPNGTVDEVLDWVGDDPQRAQQALDAEKAGKDRTTLVEALEALASQ